MAEKWVDSEPSVRKAYLCKILDKVESVHPNTRTDAARILLYIVQGIVDYPPQHSFNYMTVENVKPQRSIVYITLNSIDLGNTWNFQKYRSEVFPVDG